MKSVITKKGQVVVPVALRKKYNIETGTKMQWIDTGTIIKVVPIPRDPIEALRGCSEGEELTKTILKNRKEDKGFE